MIPVSEPDIGQKEIEYVNDAVKSRWVSSHGKYIDKLEVNFSRFIGTKYGLTVSNGTTALHLALSAIGIKYGDEVIVPDLTFISPVNAVLYCNATPVLCDIDRKNWCIDSKLVEELITEKTKAIIVVHLYGNSADMDKIMEVAERHKIFVIEDTAESLGTTYKGRKLGSIGTIGCFSFYGNKTMTTGEGGFCTTNSQELYEKMTMLRDHGMIPSKRYWHEFIGYNYRLTNLQAALGVAQLERINYFVNRKHEIGKIYKEKLNGKVLLHPEGNDYSGTYWLYSVLLNDEKERDNLIKFLYQNGIDTRKFFYPVHIMPPYERYSSNNYPISTDISGKGINLPSSVRLEDEEVNYVCNKIIEFLRNKT